MKEEVIIDVNQGATDFIFFKGRKFSYSRTNFFYVFFCRSDFVFFSKEEKR